MKFPVSMALCNHYDACEGKYPPGIGKRKKYPENEGEIRIFNCLALKNGEDIWKWSGKK